MTAVLVPQRGVLRAVRGATLAVASALLAGTAHVAAGGSAPDGALATLLTLVVAAAGTALADRRRGAPALLAAVGTTQVLLHLLFEGLGTHPAGAAASQVHTPAMTAAHALAAGITALLLAGAESAVFTVAAAWRRIVATVPQRVPSPLIPARPPVRPITPADVPAPLRVLLATLLRRRGPPVRS